MLSYTLFILIYAYSHSLISIDTGGGKKVNGRKCGEYLHNFFTFLKKIDIFIYKLIYLLNW